LITDWHPTYHGIVLAGHRSVTLILDVLDYSGRFDVHVRDVDVVIDPVGGVTTVRSWPVMRSGGTLVAIAGEPDPGQGGRGDVRGVYLVVRPDGGQLRELAALVDKQQLRPAVSAVFDLAALPEAFQAQRAARPLGKVIISVSRTTCDDRA
jgi:NADPH:quinone reductase-like Zn-dependent oxidoreductase